MHGQQEGGAYNGHFESVCYHPLFLFNDGGDCQAAKLRPGNVHSSDDWDELLVPEIERQHANGRRVAVRADAAFAKPEIYEALETRGVDFVRRDGRALDQGRQTGGPLDVAVLSPVPRERGPAAVERARLQPRESEAAARVTQRIDSWSLTSVQQRLVKTGGRLVKHARYYWLLLAERYLTRHLFGAMLQRIWALPVPTG